GHYPDDLPLRPATNVPLRRQIRLPHQHLQQLHSPPHAVCDKAAAFRDSRRTRQTIQPFRRSTLVATEWNPFTARPFISSHLDWVYFPSQISMFRHVLTELVENTNKLVAL